MIFDTPPPERSRERRAITDHYLADETACLEALIAAARLTVDAQDRVQHRAADLVLAVRDKVRERGGMDAFLSEYDLSSQEGVVLMCIAESLLRIPDDDTADRLIQDKITKGEWDIHAGQSPSWFVNASTWGLMLTGKLVEFERAALADPQAWLRRLVARSGEPVVRLAMRQAMRILGQQFVLGTCIEEALKRSNQPEQRAYRHSFDMLGEAALTPADAQRYFNAYTHAIEQLGQHRRSETPLFQAPSISVKLSALHPRYATTRRTQVLQELAPQLTRLAQQARRANICITLDAEESDRLELSLDVFEATFSDNSLRAWNGLGLAVQAYQKRAPYVLEWIIHLARAHNKRIPVRLVKGAYWDTEIKRAQEQGLAGYPVFTRKASTDVSYLACVNRLLDAGEQVYPQFATHNAHTIAYILEQTGNERDFEFQRLHGMGELLYEQIVEQPQPGWACRVYAPVGAHRDLLPYLVRRLLENGANTSFVNRITNDDIDVEEITRDPVVVTIEHQCGSHPRIPLPVDLFAPERRNSQGLNFNDEQALRELVTEMATAGALSWRAAPIINGDEHPPSRGTAVFDPSNNERQIGVVYSAYDATIDAALDAASAYHPHWSATPAEHRASVLEQVADALEARRSEFLWLLVREAGKTLPDSIAEVREAADFCRYYASLAQRHFARPIVLPGPTGESNQLTFHGRGVFACISPWNFPLAIFTGQIAAALAAGNTVIAKPSRQTALVAAHMVRLFHANGLPPQALHLLPGTGSTVGTALARDRRLAGIAFTGSTETARTINETLAGRNGPIVPFIAETGGQNAMIVDSSALPDQVVVDVIHSAFNSAGQRCSALRVLFVQEDVAGRIIELLAGAMSEIRIGDPAYLSTDVGPVIDENARKQLLEHIAYLRHNGREIAHSPLPKEAVMGSYVAPHAFQIDNLDKLKREVFGPILHVIPYSSRYLDVVVDTINNTGYGLTLGVHSRIDDTIARIVERARVGNIYVNRNMIGAVVGVQPFGGEGLSGTGPKAGGPNYLFRFATERTLSVNVAALGGNTQLLSLSD